MAKIWQPQSEDTYRNWLETLQMEASDKLNDWETNFCNDIELRLNLRIRLTEGQATKLEELYTKHTS